LHPHPQAGFVQRPQQRRFGDDAPRRRHRGRQLLVDEVADRRPSRHAVPARAERRVETHPHEAMVEPDRPSLRRGHPGQHVPGQGQPLFEQRRP